MIINLHKPNVASSSPTKEDVSRCTCSRVKIDSETSQSLLELTNSVMSHRVVTIFHRDVSRCELTKFSFLKIIHESFRLNNNRW